MGLTTVRHWMMVSALALTSAGLAACGSDGGGGGGDNGGGGDGGLSDAGSTGGEDGGTSGGEKVNKCVDGDTKTEVCSCPDSADDCEGVPGAVFVPPCCDTTTPGRSVCGVDMGVVGDFFDQDVGPLGACLARDQPGEQSDHCGAFLDYLDGPIDDAEGDNGFSTYFEMVKQTLVLPGCCTPEGLCGVQMEMPTFIGMTLDFGIGCIPLTRLLEGGGPPVPTSTEPDPGQAGALPSPGCLPGTDDAACTPFLMDAGCEALAAEGITGCDPTAPTPDWVCVSQNLPKPGTGKVPELGSDYCMDWVPEFVSGCGPGKEGDTCIANVPQNVKGCVEVTAPPAGVPEYLCGCGETTAYNPLAMLPCLSYVGEAICGADLIEVDNNGTAETTDDCLIDVPEYLKGCGDGVTPTLFNPCLKNVEAFWGCQEITENIAGFFVWQCGCGDGVAANQNDICLNEVPDTVCGTVPHSGTAVIGKSTSICGCNAEGTNPPGPNLDCFPNLVNTICGSVPPQ